MTNLKRYSRDELKFLAFNYPKKGLVYCCKQLNRSEQSIRNKCSQVGLKRDKKVIGRIIAQRNKKYANLVSVSKVGFDKNLKREEITRMYMNGVTQKHIAKTLKISKTSVQRWLTKWGIDKKWSEYDLDRLRELYPSNSKRNILKSLPLYSWRQIQKKARKIGLNRETKYKYLGMIRNTLLNNPMKNPITKDKLRKIMLEKLRKNPHLHPNRIQRRDRMTKIEEIMFSFLNELGLEKDKDFFYNNYFKTKTSYKFPDFIIPSKKIIIECDGEYWHEDQDKEKERDACFFERGYDVLHFTDKQIYNNKKDILCTIKTKLS